jgi:hypothetical protein
MNWPGKKEKARNVTGYPRLAVIGFTLWAFVGIDSIARVFHADNPPKNSFSTESKDCHICLLK